MDCTAPTWLAWRRACLVHRVGGGGPLRHQQQNNNNNVDEAEVLRTLVARSAINRQGPFLTGVPTFRKGPSQKGKRRYPVLAPPALGLAWRGAVWGAREDHLVRTGSLWSVVTVCAVALQAQVMGTPIDAPTCAEGGNPGDLSVG